MRNPKFYRGAQYREELQPLLQFSSSLVANGERDVAAILAKSHDIAQQHPLAFECWGEANGGLREILTGKLNDIEQKAKAEAAQAEEKTRAELARSEQKAALETKQKEMRERRQSVPPKPDGVVRPRGTFRPLSYDSRYRINKWGEVIGPHGTSLTWAWDLLTAIPSVKIAGKSRSILSLLQDVGFQKRKERKTVPKPAPTVNDGFEAAAEDPEANPPKGYDSWAEARAEEPEMHGQAE
jgi:hypothetical protein